MPQIALILEDNKERLATFRNQLINLKVEMEPVFFESADDTIRWLREHQVEVTLISLDHDLPISRDREGNLHDCGTGQMVCDFLATTIPTCPVIVHTSNATAGTAMLSILRDAGWPVMRVYPDNGLAWIANDWAIAVQKLAGGRSKA
jgi:hypothetical protein